ncbi:hypothetical protein [Flavobacterium salmonis]|uniref:Uncharacterized protein n=1 Tax=Flavobacterium salmonis TaxID=2654844 RepID=A0A6V6Z4G3_9FLAO|nr:hypothetical protein [Flavobacterium salmonis]CAD0005832.1 hypothetical protein FLAT13_02996 [Flavobacterium salmonis]
MNTFETVYDFSSGDGFSRFAILLFPIGFFLFSKLRITPKIEEKEAEDFFLDNLESEKSIAFIIKYFSLILFVMLLILFSIKYCKTYFLYKDSKIITQGFVNNFHPMPSGGHDSERFTVNGVEFKFSDFDISDFGYNNAKSHGGAIDENKYVRISYIKVKGSNQILKLEVRK